MIEPRADEAGQTRGADDVFSLGAIASAEQVRANDKESADQAGSDHDPVSSQRQRADMNEWIHVPLASGT